MAFKNVGQRAIYSELRSKAYTISRPIDRLLPNL